MGSLSISNKILEKYFGYLKTLDNSSKERLINILKKSLKMKSENKISVNTFFGAWEDNRSSDEIISEIKDSRLEKKHNETFE